MDISLCSLAQNHARVILAACRFPGHLGIDYRSGDGLEFRRGGRELHARLKPRVFPDQQMDFEYWEEIRAIAHILSTGTLLSKALGVAELPLPRLLPVD